MDREQYGQDWQNLHGCVPRVSADFNPRAAPWPGSQAMRRCLIMNPDRIIAGRHCQGRPAQVAFSLNRGGMEAPLGHGVRCAALLCPGSYPYCWYEIFKVRQREIGPSLSLLNKSALKRNTLQKFFYENFKLPLVLTNHLYRHAILLSKSFGAGSFLSLQIRIQQIICPRLPCG